MTATAYDVVLVCSPLAGGADDMRQRQRLSYEGLFVGAARQYENYYEYDSAGNRTLPPHGETGADFVGLRLLMQMGFDKVRRGNWA